MKKHFSILFAFVLACMFILIPSALADDMAIVAPAGFEWIGPIINFILAIPKVGPILGTVFQVVSAVAGVMTFVSVAVVGILGIPEIAARFAGAPDLANKIKAFSDKVLPFLKYFSIFNVQKKP